MLNEKETYLLKLREEFKARHGVYPWVIHVGQELYRDLCPIRHPALALETTLVLESKKIPPQAVVMIKPPEVRKAA